MSGVSETTSDPGQASASTAPAAASTGAPQAAQSTSPAGDEDAQPVQDSQQQAPKEAEEKRPRPEWETAWDLEEYWKARKTFFTDDERAKAWEETAKIVQEYSDDMVKRWNGEIDTLLTYAGLFSAIQTAFNIEFYKRLIPSADSSDPDPVLLALERISAQLSGFAMNQAFVNSTQPPFILRNSASTTPAVPLWVIVLNALWFLSLILSLAAAFIGIMVKQWLTEYKAGVSGTERQTARLRQLRLNSLQRWRVKEIVSIIPVLLQLASGLFFAGLLILLWNLNRPVAIVGSVFVGLLAVFALSTIILPSVVTHCSYLSPPSRVLFELTRPWRKALHHCRCQLSSWVASCYDCNIIDDFDDFDRRDSQVEILWTVHPRIYRICKLLFPRDAAFTLAWRGMESALVSRRAEELDGELIETAYKTSMDTDYLAHAAVCTTELTPSVVRICFQDIRSASIAHWGEGTHTEAMWSVHPCMWSSALVAFITTPGEDLAWTPSASANALMAAYSYIMPRDQHVRSDAPRARLACVDIARVIQHCDDDTLPPDCKDIPKRLLNNALPTMMAEMVETKLGNDFRQYVASICAQEALKALDQLHDGYSNSVSSRFADALRSMVSCVPLPGVPDCMLEDCEYKAWQSHLSDSIYRLLSTEEALQAQPAKYIYYYICEWLRKHGEAAGLMSPELMQTIMTYLEEYMTMHGDFYEDSWYEFIEELTRKLAERSGKNAGVAVTELALRRTEGPLSVDAASLTKDDNLRRFHHALRCVLRCIPPPGPSNCLPDDPVYKAVLERAVGALRTFAHFLPASLSRPPFGIVDVFMGLEGHWKRAGLISADLALAIIDCLEAYETTYGYFWSRTWYEFIEELTRKLAESSGTNSAVAVMQSALKRTEGPLSVDAASLTEDDNLRRFCLALRCVLRCIPPPGSSDCKPDDPVYRAVLERAVSALRTFSHLLPVSLSRSPAWITGVFNELEGHWKRAGLISADLALAIIDCLEVYETMAEYFPINSWYEFIEELTRKLAESSGKNGAVAVMESALKRTEGPLSVDAALLTEDDNLRRFCLALRCVLRCIPPPGSSDCKPDDPVYRAAQERGEYALRTFSDFLSTSEAVEYSHQMEKVFDDLREHGERAGLMSPELIRAIITYMVAYETEWGYYYMNSWREFIEELNCKHAASSGQTAAVYVMESALRRTKGPLSLDAASLKEDGNLERFRNSLFCIIRCIPPSGPSDCKPADPVYEAGRERAVHALKTFSQFLSTSEPSKVPHKINDIFDDLCNHEDSAGLMSAELRQAIVRYWDAYCSKYHRDAWPWEENEEWIQKLKGELQNSEQNAPASNARLISEDTDSHSTTTHAPSPVFQDVADTQTASPQAAGDDRGAHSARMKTAVNQSSASTPLPSSGHATATTNGESTGSVVDKEDADRDTAEDGRDADDCQTEEASGVKGSVSDTPPSPGGPAPT